MNDECCPKFEPKRWDEKVHKWENKSFIKESILQFFHIPFPQTIGKKITKLWNLAESSKKNLSKKEDALILFYDPSAFKSEIYLSVSGDVPDAENVKFSGTFISKVFDGPYGAVPKFIKQMDEFLTKKNKKAKKYYIHYAYCPQCAKKFGHNYAILFAEI
jgi:hypothetical protein